MMSLAFRSRFLCVLLVAACAPKDSDPLPADGSTGSDDAPTTAASESGTTAASDATGTQDEACEAAGLEASRDAFEAARDAAAGQYWYTATRTVFDEFFIPACRYETTIIVEAGVVVERRVVLAGGTADGDPAACTTPDFVETGDEVGTSEDLGVAPAVLLETLYDGCCNEVIRIEPAEDYDVNFEVDEAGVMSACYYIMNSCGEGCDGGPMGYGSIFLDAVGFGPPPA